MKKVRVFLIVLDSFGMGAAPDAADFGDAGSNTLLSVGSSAFFHAPNMTRMGLFNIDGIAVEMAGRAATSPAASFGRLTEKSPGKDTTVGHWEIAGCAVEKPLPTYPKGFPAELIAEFERRTGRRVICNKTYSGTEVLQDYGLEQIQTGALIVYTSADSVFQIAAHEKYIGLAELYRCCEIARAMLQGEHNVGRVIARPYAGEYPHFSRTPNRHDYSLKPPRNTMLDYLQRQGFDTIGVGKISDIFAGSGISEHLPTKGNKDGMDQTLAVANRSFSGLCFLNLVDFDMVYGHRNDIDGYARAVSEFDEWLGKMAQDMLEDDYLLVTADHGCDPSFPGTDHTREYVPLLVYGNHVKPGINLGTRGTFADIAATVLDIFDAEGQTDGESFLDSIRK